MLLVNEYFTDDQLNVYNEILLKISQKYFKEKEYVLKDYYQEIKEIYDLNQASKESEIQISEYYSYTAAVEDFQAGIRLFKTKNFDQAYNILRKVLLKFEQENNKNLIMEVLYIIGSLFTQQKKFKVAKEYFKRLKKLANEMQHKKYSEISIFMQGFCAYKNENYASALKKFEKINFSKAQFINKLQFYTIYGRILVNQEKNEEALQAFSKALIISTEMKLSDTLKKQQSQILYELGVINYRIATENLKGLGINKQDNYKSYLQEAINYFKQAIKLLINLNECNTLIQIYQLIGNIYDFLNKKQNSLEYYEKALKVALESNNLDKQIKIVNRIVQKQIKEKMYEESIAKLNDLLSNIDKYKFIDLYTISNFHWQLADCLIAIGKTKEGLLELLKTFEILKTFKIPIFEKLKLLNQIIEICTELEDNEKIAYYNEEINKISKDLKKVSIQKPKVFRPLGDIKEIWIFHSNAGIEIFSYAHETKFDCDLLGGFLTAIQQFSLEISQKRLNDMVIGGDRYMIYRKEGYDFYILGRADLKVSTEIVKSILSTIYRRFWKEYSRVIKNFEGNIGYFKSFTQIIESLDLT